MLHLRIASLDGCTHEVYREDSVTEVNRNVDQHAPGRSAVRVEDLSRLIREKRREEGLTLEQAARASGLTLATLARWERPPLARVSGTPRSPDTRTLALLARWLNVSITRVLDVEVPPEAHTIVHRESDTVPDIVEAHLRADRNLDEKTASSLGKLFRLAYEQYASLSDAPADGGRDEQLASSDQENEDGTQTPGTGPTP
jgi:transcriptional regulator with XRE-family HTH domain